MGEVRTASLPATTREARFTAMLGYTAALVGWTVLVGLPRQTFTAFAWIWLATVAWNAGAPWRVHLAFPRDWGLPLLVLTVYLYSRGLADDLGLAAVHVTEPVAADRALFGGVLPTEYLQAALCGVPCERSSPPAWYDVVLTTVYYSHFFVALTTAAVLWLRNRAAWVPYMRRYLTLNIVALVVYLAYPMAPPWLAVRDGAVSPDVARITGRGWYDLRDVGWHDRFSAVGNPVAAMPSLHAAIALFVALYAISRWRSRWRWLLLLYPTAMSFMLVYYAEHYVVDVLAGFGCVGLVLAVCAAWERRRPRGSP